MNWSHLRGHKPCKRNHSSPRDKRGRCRECSALIRKLAYRAVAAHKRWAKEDAQSIQTTEGSTLHRVRRDVQQDARND